MYVYNGNIKLPYIGRNQPLKGVVTMFRIINTLVTIVVSLGIFSGVQLYQYETTPVPQKNVPPIVKKIEPPKEAPKLLNQKLVSKYEFIDSLDKAFSEHISTIISKSHYNCMGKDKRDYVESITSALLHHTNGNLELALWVASMAYTESSFRLNADPKTSSARGFLQVIYKYHERELKKAGISREDLSSNPSKSIQAGILVFQRYLRIEHGDYVRATRRYRGLSVTERQQRAYLNSILRKKKEFQIVLNQYA